VSTKCTLLWDLVARAWSWPPISCKCQVSERMGNIPSLHGFLAWCLTRHTDFCFWDSSLNLFFIITLTKNLVLWDLSTLQHIWLASQWPITRQKFLPSIFSHGCLQVTEKGVDFHSDSEFYYTSWNLCLDEIMFTVLHHE
jgi:hypothetical protein